VDWKRGRQGRQTYSMAVIAAASEEGGKGTGWIRMPGIPDAWGRNLPKVLEDGGTESAWFRCMVSI
jgi:hypothetical protein